jgi:hypothetical protein
MAAVLVPLIIAALLGLIATSIMAAKRSRPSTAGDGMSGEERVRAYGLVLRDALSRTMFGPALMQAVWRKLMTCSVGDGLVGEFHRDFCGHGLIRDKDGVKLCDVHDGGLGTGEAIAHWSSKEAFVAFFAAQSDFSCSGWDASEPVFASADEWYRNNQRLTREKLLDFVEGRVAR